MKSEMFEMRKTTKSTAFKYMLWMFATPIQTQAMLFYFY
jgi:hypothetical protein